MHILHISGDFSNTPVHAYLYKQLDDLGVKQTVFNPLRTSMCETIGRNEFPAQHTQFIYTDVIKPFHRYTYHIKRWSIFNSLQKKIDLKDINIVHASTLFSDGGQAYKIYKKYQIPYVVAVRNTDINGFLNKLPNTWAAGRKILKNAKKIFFISKALMDTFSCHKVIMPIFPEIKDKMMLIPNGIDEYFIEHQFHDWQEREKGKVLYVGNFSRNKNVVRLCEAVLQLQKEGEKDIHLTLVGGGGRDEDENVQVWLENHKDVATFLGPIYDKEKLCKVFRSHSVFAMPSFTETFGLVYLEALSQNLPVIYTKGQGIDGLFDDTIGIGVYPGSVDSIKNAINEIMNSPIYFSNKNVDFENFRWKNVAEKYLEVYNSINKN